VACLIAHLLWAENPSAPKTLATVRRFTDQLQRHKYRRRLRPEQPTAHLATPVPQQTPADRSREVRALRLEDLNWVGEIITIERTQGAKRWSFWGGIASRASIQLHSYCSNGPFTAGGGKGRAPHAENQSRAVSISPVLSNREFGEYNPRPVIKLLLVETRPRRASMQ
jgi:hypothetical protein